MFDKVELKKFFDLPQIDHLYCGFSGGADSCAALLLACHYFAGSVTAVHFQHHLRPEAEKEARWAEQFARDLGLEFLRFDLEIPAAGNLESRCREERLKVWKQLASSGGSAVVLGHHADDAAETLLLRLSRGSNVSGLAGLRSDSVVSGVRFLRPLLDFSRSEIESFLHRCGVDSWQFDLSNSSCDYLRNYLRNRLLPDLYAQNPPSRQGLRHSVAALMQDADFIEESARNYYALGDPETLDFWRKAHLALRPRLLRLFVQEFSGMDQLISNALMERFNLLLESNSAGNCRIPWKQDVELVIAQERLSLRTPVPEPVIWQWRKEKTVRWGKWQFQAEIIDTLPENCPLDSACFALGSLPEGLLIRGIAPGDKLCCFGSGRIEKVKKLRIDRKIPAYPVNPAVCTDEHIIWLPGIRHSEHCRVPENCSGKAVLVRSEKL